MLNHRAAESLSLLRIAVSLLFMAHGVQKIFGFPTRPKMGMPELNSLIGAAGLLELIGGFLVLIGLFTRPVAFILSGLMAVAYFMAHATKGFYPILNGGELAIVYSFAFLHFSLAGPGSWSFDERLIRK